MTRQTWIAGLVTAATVLAAGTASAFTSSNYMRVNPVSDSVFEVLPRGGARRSGDYWCAAAEYLLFTGVSNATQRIYVVRALGPGQTANRRSTVQFSITPPAGVDTTPGISLTVRRVGENMSAHLARSQCFFRDPIFIP
ncbi:MAG: hypothetical protein AB3N23_22450 [Paracoccaceae bacterium]